MKEMMGIMIVALPGILAGLVAVRMAWARGRSIVGWGLLCLAVPVCVLIIWSKPPVREVRGGFQRCPRCSEWLKWGETPCRYCKAELLPPT